MGFDLHTIVMPNGAGPYLQDRLVFGSVLGVPFPAASKGVGAVGAVTAGTGYTFTPTITPTGGTVTPQVLTGGQVTTPVGWQALIRPVMKVISAGVATGGGGSGYVTNDVVYFGNGIFLTATATAGVVTSWAVTQAGSFLYPGGLPATAAQVSASGVGVGAVASLVWGIGTVSIDDSGNYSVLPTGYTVASVDGNGTGGALALGTPAITAGLSSFRAIYAGVQPVQPTLSGLFVPAPNYGFTGSLNTPTLDFTIQAKVNGYVSVAITPVLAASLVVAGTIDGHFWA